MRNSQNLYKVFLCHLIALSCITLSACTTSSPKTDQFDPESCNAQEYQLLLCIDLRNDRTPRAGLVIKRDSTGQPVHRYIDLPFAATAVQDNNQISSTAGKYSDRTRITYSTSPDSPLISGIGIEPKLGLPPNGSASAEALPDAIYLMRPAASERRFVFKAVPSPSGNKVDQGKQPNGPYVGDTLDALVVILPSDARPLGINGAQASIPMPKHTRDADGRVWYYPMNDLRDKKYLELSYLVTSAGYWAMAFEGAIPLVALLLVPLLALIFLKPEDRVRPRARRIGIAVGVGLELIILLALALYLWKVSVPSESEIKLIIQSITSVLGALLGGFVLWVAIKRQPKQEHS